MADPEVLDPLPPRGETPLLMHVLYAMHTLSWITMGLMAVVALLANYIRAGDEPDPLYRAHHRYMIRTFWWTLLWLVLTSPLYLLFVMPGMLAHMAVGLWYLYRCLRGWLRFADRRWPQEPPVLAT